MADVHPLVAAVLAVTPTMVVPSYTMPGGESLPDRAVIIGGADALPVATAQAAAVIRALDGMLATGWLYGNLLGLADEIEASTC